MNKGIKFILLDRKCIDSMVPFSFTNEEWTISSLDRQTHSTVQVGGFGVGRQLYVKLDDDPYGGPVHVPLRLMDKAKRIYSMCVWEGIFRWSFPMNALMSEIPTPTFAETMAKIDMKLPYMNTNEFTKLVQETPKGVCVFAYRGKTCKQAGQCWRRHITQAEWARKYETKDTSNKKK